MEVPNKSYLIGFICQNIVGLTLALLLAFHFKLGLSGLLYGYAIGLVCISFANLIMYAKTSWDTVEENLYKKWKKLVQTKFKRDSFSDKATNPL